MPDVIVDVIFQPRPAHLHFLDLLVRRNFDLFFNTADRVVQLVVLLEHLPESVIARFEASYSFAAFRKLPQNRMM